MSLTQEIRAGAKAFILMAGARDLDARKSRLDRQGVAIEQMQRKLYNCVLTGFFGVLSFTMVFYGAVFAPVCLTLPNGEMAR